MIKACRLVTGEFLIGDVNLNVIQKSQSITSLESCFFTDPLLFDVREVQRGEHRVGFMPLIPLSSPGDKAEISFKDIMFWIEKPSDQIVDNYKRVVSLIVQPNDKKKGIVTP